MARTKGDMAYPTSVDIVGKKPLDAKMLVRSKADLTNPDTWRVYNSTSEREVDSFYQGMIVSVSNDSNQQNNGLYRLANGSDVTNIENWEKLGEGGSGAGSTTIKGTWQPTVTGEPALTNYDQLLDLGGVGINNCSVSGTKLTCAEGETAAAIATLPETKPSKLASYLKLESVAGTFNIFYMYNMLLGSTDPEDTGSYATGVMYFYEEGELRVYSTIDDTTTIVFAEWNPLVDSMCAVFDFTAKTCSYYTNRDTATPLSVHDISTFSDSLSYVLLYARPYDSSTESTPDFVISGATSFALTGADSDAINPVQGTQVIDLTPPENAANNAFILDVEESVYIPDLDKELESGDIVFFDGDSVPFRYIPKEFAGDVDLSEYAKKTDLSPYAKTSDVENTLEDYTKTSELADVALSGKASDLDNDAGFLGAAALLGKTPYTPIRLTAADDLNDITTEGWYVYAFDTPPANAFATQDGWTASTAGIDVLMEVYKKPKLSAPDYYVCTVQVCGRDSSYFAGSRETDASGNWPA